MSSSKYVMNCFGADGAVSASRPVLEAPNGTMRLEILRDGIEDYEYFAILSRVDPENALLKVPPEVSSSLKDSRNVRSRSRRTGADLLKRLKDWRH